MGNEFSTTWPIREFFKKYIIISHIGIMNSKKNFFSSLLTMICVLIGNTVYSDWDPQFLISESLIRGTYHKDLNSQKFINLKQQVLEFLAHTWCSEEKAELIMELLILERPQTCVEIGVFTGSSFLPIAATLKYLHQGRAYGIDAWSNDEAIKNMDECDPNKNWWATVDMKWVYQAYKKMLKEWDLNSYCTTLKENSECAVSKLDAIDFLHMDGNYTHDSALADAINYLPKVKIGGYILFSNLFFTVQGDQPKMDAYFYLLDFCEIICGVDNDNTILLKKISDIPEE